MRQPIRRSVFLAAQLAISAIIAGPAQAAVPHPNMQDETQCLALAVYWEGKTESRIGQLAIAHTVLNRTKSDDFPNTVCGVIVQRNGSGKRGCQFNWYCDGKADRPQSEAEWNEAVEIAREAMNEGSRDPTGGALYFHSSKIKPKWDGARQRLMRIGNHVFYR